MAKSHWAITPSSGVVMPEIDGFRALAAFSVLACHATLDNRWPPPRWISFAVDGGFGVELFFVLSGFLLSLSFARSAHEKRAAPALGPYAVRRVLRILPAYYVNLALSVLFFWPESLTTSMGRATLAAHFTLTFAVSAGMLRAISPVYWTLAVEEQFYLLLPFVSRVLSGRTGIVLLFATLFVPNAVIIPWRAHFGAEAGILAASLLYHWTAFGLGMLIAQFHVRFRSDAARKPKRLPTPIAPAVLVAGIAIAVYATADPLLSCQARALGSALMVGAILFGPTWLGAPLRLRPVRTLGLWTFSMYLWHFPVATRVTYLSDPPTDAVSFVARVLVVLLFTLPFAAGSFFLVERPFIQLRKRLGDGAKETSVVPVEGRP